MNRVYLLILLIVVSIHAMEQKESDIIIGALYQRYHGACYRVDKVDDGYVFYSVYHQGHVYRCQSSIFEFLSHVQDDGVIVPRYQLVIDQPGR